MRYVTSIVLSLPLIGAYAIFAIGIVLIYRASRVLNIAHGAMAMIPAYLLYEMTRAGIPIPVALPLAVASGGLLGWSVERVFVRRLRGESPTAQTVGTVAALALMVAVAAQIWGTASREATRIFPDGRISIGLSNIQYGELGLFLVMLAVTGVLFILIQRTDLGLKMRGSAESQLAASLMGVNPQRMITLAWVLGGSLAALAGILLAAVTSLHPYVLPLQALPAFIAALLGGLGSLLGALAGAAVVGVTQGLVPVLGSLGRAEGAPQLLLAILAMVVMASRGDRLVAGDIRQTLEEVGGDAPTHPDGPEQPEPSKPGTRAQGRLAVPSLRQTLSFLGIGFAVLFPFIAPFSALGAANLGATYALVAVSIVVLTGWVGQISLGHAALVGIGAYMTGWATSQLGIPFPLSLPIAALLAGAFAALLGVVALRVRGLYLAVATLVFSWMASEFLFRQRWFTAHDQIPDRVIGGPGWFPSFDLSNRRVLYFVGWILVAAAMYAAANVRASKTGRAFFAVRGSEMAAASLGIDVVRTKLIAFAVSGVIAGAAGNLVMVMQRVITADQFTFNASLLFLAIAVVGGLTSLGGALASALVFAGLTEVFFRFPVLGQFLQLVSALLLAAVLLIYRGGLASLPSRFNAAYRRIGRSLSRMTEKAGGRVERLAGSADALRASAARFRRSKLIRRMGDIAWIDRLQGHARALARRAAPVTRRVAERIPKPSLSRMLPMRSVTENGRMHTPGDGPLDFRALLDTQDLQPVAAEPLNESSKPVSPSLSVDEASSASSASGNGRSSNWSQRDITRLIAEQRPTGPRELRRPLIEAEHVTVRFGGLVAVSDASLSVCEGEITGLIGPNGAGKTTLFNAIAGYNTPTSGTVKLYGREVSGLPVHLRARIGVARTFQLLQLFGELSVYDNLLVATHTHNPTSFLSHVLASDWAILKEGEARERVEQVLELLDMRSIANRRARDLPFGVLRMVEVARALVTGFRLIMLDEPASGLDNTETDRLMEVLRFVRRLGVTMLLIEHDVRMVTGVSDYIYVLDQGKLIAEGSSEHVQRDPAVIAAYLGESKKEREAV